MESTKHLRIFAQNLKEQRVHFRYFRLFDSDAFIAWDDGNSEVDVLCHNQFIKGKAQGNYYPFSYDLARKVWSPFPPKGCATQIKEAIYEIVISCNPHYGSTEDPT